MESKVEVQLPQDATKEDAPDIDHEAIMKSLQRLLTQLYAPNQDPDTPFPFPTTREDLNSLLAVCEEIETGANQLVAECSNKRNTFLPIHQLPSVVVVKILLASLSSEKFSWKGPKHTFLHRQKELRLVCTRWNEIIKTTPSFWSTVSCADIHETRLRTALKLSMDAPLEIVCRFGGSLTSKFHCRPFAAEMSGVAHRWSSLDLKGNYWAEYLTLPAPELTSVKIQGKQGSDTNHTWLGTFLGGQAPKLREMTLKDFAIPWDNWTVPSLERLEIQCIQEGPTVAQVLEILSQCKKLTECTLHQIRIQPLPGSDTWTAERPPVDCPSLRDIRFERVRLDSVVQILNNLQLPAECMIRVVASNHQSSFGPFMDFVRRRIPKIRSDGDAADSVCIDLEDTPAVSLAFPGHLWKLHFTLFDGKWQDDETKWNDCGEILRDIRPAFGDVEPDPGVNLWILRRQVKRGLQLVRDTYPNVSRLCTVTDPDTLSLLSKPQPFDRGEKAEGTTDGDSGDKPAQWLFPSLEDLHLYSQPNTTGLLEFVESRRNNPDVKPIKKLVVDNSSTPEEVQTKLKPLVSDLRFRVT